jgi:hypothetical protein
VTAAEIEIHRLRACLKALSEATGNQTARIELTFKKNPTRLWLTITMSNEASETVLGEVVLEYLDRCGLRPLKAKRGKGGKRA